MLEPWRIEGYDEETVRLVNYAVEIEPKIDEASGAARPLPRLAYGSFTLITSRERERVIEALLRVLSSHGRAPTAGQVRLGLVPVTREGQAVLAPLRNVLPISERWFESRGMTRIDTVSSLVEPSSLSVILDPTLGSSEKPAALPLLGWYLPPPTDEVDFSAGRAVAQAMGLAIDISVDNAAVALRGIADTIERMPPQLAAGSPADSREALEKALVA